MLFQQTAAPTGWTKQTTHNDKGLRVVTGTVGSGGSQQFSSVFRRTTTDGFTLSTMRCRIRSRVNDPTHAHAFMIRRTLMVWLIHACPQDRAFLPINRLAPWVVIRHITFLFLVTLSLLPIPALASTALYRHQHLRCGTGISIAGAGGAGRIVMGWTCACST